MSGPRSLHICNLANVAYGFCKILRQAGEEVELRCHDPKHLMSQPEWDDLELKAEDFPDEWNFHDNTADFGGYRRPAWYRSTGFEASHFRELPELGAADAGDGRSSPGQAPSALGVAWSRVSGRVERWLADAPSRGTAVAAAAPRPALHSAAELRGRLSAARFEWLVEESRKHGPAFEIDLEMLAAYRPHAWWAREHSRAADVVFAYVYGPIYTMLLGDRPWVSIEIGTMRDIPFDGTGDGRLLALAYRLSPHVLITNPDVAAKAEELGVESYSFCPHPLDEEVYCPEPSGEFRRNLLAESDAEFILFAPARQNWEIKRNDRYLRAFGRLVRDGGLRAALIIPGWGQEVERSRRLCRELGIERWVRWIPPQSESLLVKFYQAADFVLDQFDLGVFGLITPKALSCGAVVVTSYEPGLNAWCFDEHPPLVAATTTGEIYQAISSLCANPARRRQLGDASRQWVLDHHSKRRIYSVLREAMAIARSRHAASA